MRLCGSDQCGSRYSSYARRDAPATMTSLEFSISLFHRLSITLWKRLILAWVGDPVKVRSPSRWQVSVEQDATGQGDRAFLETAPTTTWQT